MQKGLVCTSVSLYLISYKNVDLFLELFKLIVLRLGTFDDVYFQEYPVKISTGFMIVTLIFTATLPADFLKSESFWTFMNIT